MNHMAAIDWMELLCLKKILALHFVKVMSCPNLPLLFVIVFWGETNKSILLQMFFKICLHKNFANFTGKHQCWSAFLMKLQLWRSAMLLRSARLHHRFFPVNLFLKTPFFTEHLRWLLLNKPRRSLWFILCIVIRNR